jgi:hypothetical protein
MSEEIFLPPFAVKLLRVEHPDFGDGLCLKLGEGLSLWEKG